LFVDPNKPPPVVVLEVGVPNAPPPAVAPVFGAPKSPPAVAIVATAAGWLPNNPPPVAGVLLPNALVAVCRPTPDPNAPPIG
jgi:hypothetical protein